MANNLFTAAGAVSDVLTLSKAAWRIGFSLTTLDQNTGVVEAFKDLADEARSLSTVCDSVQNELEEVDRKIEAGTPPPYSIDGRIWGCLSVQIDDARQSLNELELFVQALRGNKSSSTDPSKWGESKGVEDLRSQISRHIDNFRTTLLLIKT